MLLLLLLALEIGEIIVDLLLLRSLRLLEHRSLVFAALRELVIGRHLLLLLAVFLLLLVDLLAVVRVVVVQIVVLRCARLLVGDSLR